jgi:methylated-DNA-[protein]-cysteine S-methyltransferase
VLYTTYDFAKGKLFLGKTEKGLCIVKFIQKAADIKNTVLSLEKISVQVKAANKSAFLREIKLFDRYFQGKPDSFDSITPDYIFGTPYQQNVWNKTRNIPYGKTVSYKDLALQLLSRGYRSVGQALGKNPLLIIVPCHRIILSDGSLGGFGAGLGLKKWLLALEAHVEE